MEPLRAVDSPPGDLVVLQPRALAAMADHVRTLRELLFALCDDARAAAPLEAPVHVGLQAAANQLGEVERLLTAGG